MDYSPFTPLEPWLLAVLAGAIIASFLTGQPLIAVLAFCCWAVFGILGAIK
jgi:hypothetical protein